MAANTVHATKLQMAVLNQVSTINDSNVLYSVLFNNVLLCCGFLEKRKLIFLTVWWHS